MTKLMDMFEKSEFGTETIVGFFGSILALLTIFIKKLTPRILDNKRKKVIQYDHDKLIEAYQEIQDVTIEIGAIRGHALYYENHGPQKMSIMLEAKGHPCGNCISKCEMFFKSGVRRVSREWDKRKVHPFWLVYVVNKTLKLHGSVHTVTREEAQHDQEQLEIWEDVGTHMIKECYVKSKGDHQFITVVFEFCLRFKDVKHLDIKIQNLAYRLRDLL